MAWLRMWKRGHAVTGQPEVFVQIAAHEMSNGYVFGEWLGTASGAWLFILVDPASGSLQPWHAPPHEEDGELPAHIVRRIWRKRRWWRRLCT